MSKRIILVWTIAIALLLGGEISPVFAQNRQTIRDGEKAYELLPNFPREDRYISNESGDVDEDSTLLARMIYYHIYVKNRPPQFRFDWKLTIADYLGANENMLSSQYSGADELQENPLAGDREVIDRLSRKEREELIQTLVGVFNPDLGNESSDPVSGEQRDGNDSRSPSNNPNVSPRFPQPGDAQLLQ